jgi:hypothetical protein
VSINDIAISGKVEKVGGGGASSYKGWSNSNAWICKRNEERVKKTERKKGV